MKEIKEIFGLGDKASKKNTLISRLNVKYQIYQVLIPGTCKYYLIWEKALLEILLS